MLSVCMCLCTVCANPKPSNSYQASKIIDLIYYIDTYTSIYTYYTVHTCIHTYTHIHTYETYSMQSGKPVVG